RLHGGGTLGPTDLVWKNGLAAWVAAGTVKELQPAPAAAPPPPPPPPPPPAPAEWYYAQSGQRQGPVTADQVRQLQADGTLKPADLVWKNGLAGWVALSTVPELKPAASVKGKIGGFLSRAVSKAQEL